LAKFVEKGNCVEAEKSEIFTRKKTTQKMVNFPNVGRFIKYKCQQNSSMEILEELNPKAHLINAESNLNKNDIIEGEIIEVYCSKQLKDANIKSNYSSTHSIQQLKPTCYAYGIIFTPFKFILERVLKG
jgi:hypothetical protein